MTPRERVLAAINRRQPDKVPKTAGFTPAVMERFRQETGSNSPADYFGMEPRGVGFAPTTKKTDFSVFFDEYPENAATSEWGCTRVRGDFYHFTRPIYVMAGFTSAEQVLAYPWPDTTADYRHEGLGERVARLHEAGWFVQGGVGHIFETAWQLRGMDRLFLDCVENPDIAAGIFDQITERKCFMARRYAEAGVDILHLGDDVGMQDRLMMSPGMWREWLKPRLAKVIASGRAVNPDLHIFYHSDGTITQIIPDLIEVGVTVLNPVQPECMDPVALKAQYGDVLAFWGTIGTQTTMPFGTVDDVRQTVKRMIETVGVGGGLVLAPTHVLEPDVPWENIVAMFEAIETYGAY